MISEGLKSFLPLILPPCRFTEKGNLEVLLFTIQSKMRANNQKVYMPREGKLISDINKVRRPPEIVDQTPEGIKYHHLAHDQDGTISCVFLD